MEKAMDSTSAASPIALLGIILSLIILDWVITLQDFYSSLRCLLQTFIHFVSYTWKVWAESNNPIDAEALTQKLCFDENVDDEKLFRGEVETVMERLGITSCDRNGDDDKLQDRLGSDEIALLFEEEPSPEEVEEAFNLFDENGDGFIDGRELEKVFSTLGFMVASEVECKRMIRAFDDNGDGRIDFNEFVKLLENSFC